MFPAAAAYRTEPESYESEEGDDAATSTGDTLCETESPISELSQLPPCSRSEPSSSQSSGATSTPPSAHHDVPEHVGFLRQARHRASVSGCHHAKRPCKHATEKDRPEMQQHRWNNLHCLCLPCKGRAEKSTCTQNRQDTCNAPCQEIRCTQGKASLRCHIGKSASISVDSQQTTTFSVSRSNSD